jgi:aminopeptidase N
MENKGLNVFNSKYVLARPETATDTDYLGIESVIGHEYFHNWTGNRVTCRDWFQLSLKEGLTVFRDQQFSADMNSAAVKRIDDVRILRQFQFPEDAGPMAHPVRPEAYQEINNFYTTTIYNKGAEVIRMMQTLLGREKFISGVQLYLQRHDGQAVTCDDFVAAMEGAGAIDLTLFKNWYRQAGTPQVMIQQIYDGDQHTLTLKISQHCSATPGQKEKQPFHIPIAIGLIDAAGDDLPLQLSWEEQPGATIRVLNLTDSEQIFTFVGMKQQPVLSPLRGFSAPVRLECDFSDDELAFRMAYDCDAFNRWEAGQTLASSELLRIYKDLQAGHSTALQSGFVAAWRKALSDRQVDQSLLAQLLTLPSEQYLADQLNEFDPQGIRAVRDQAILQLAQENQSLLLERYSDCFTVTADYSLDSTAVGRRSLGNFCLSLLVRLDQPEMAQLCLRQYQTATNMTDRLAAFSSLVDSSSYNRQEVIDDFYQSWKQQPLLLDKWFAIQALSHRNEVFAEVETLLQHADFSLSNPNRVRALLGAFSQNMAAFHRPDGAGYKLLVERIILLDQKNPQVAARMAAPLTRWKHLEIKRRKLMKQQLLRLQKMDLSSDLYEIVNKSLK